LILDPGPWTLDHILWTLDPKSSTLDFPSIVLKIENEFHTQGLSTMLLCNKRLDEAGQLVVIESQTVTDNVWKIVDVNECFCKSMHVTRSQIRFMDWLKLCGKATESKSLLKIVQVRPVLAAYSAEAAPLAPSAVETHDDTMIKSCSEQSQTLKREQSCSDDTVHFVHDTVHFVHDTVHCVHDTVHCVQAKQRHASPPYNACLTTHPLFFETPWTRLCRKVQGPLR
jgi:hypothetical protein